MPNFNKKDLIAAITDQLENPNLTQEVVGEVIDSMLEIIVDRLSCGDDVALRKFGQFTLMEAKEKLGRNPKKPQEVAMIPARSMVKFRPSEETKSEVAKALPYLRQRQK